MPSLLDSGQIIKAVYDESSNKIRVDAEVTLPDNQEIVISHVDDSIRIGDGTKFATATQVSSKVGLDVNLIGGIVSGNFTSSGLSTGLKTQTITVTDTATKIPSVSLENRNSMSIRIWGTNIVYFGSSDVTSANGYPKRQYEEVIIDIKDNSEVELYAICDTGQTCELRILEVA